MTTATLRISTPIAEARTAPKKGLFTRFVEAMMAARMRQAVRELERHRHLIPEHLLKSSGYDATVKNDGTLPFTR
jgi:hypothetical protein